MVQKTRDLSRRQLQPDSASKRKPERKARQGRAVAAKRGTRKCWHIRDFRELFELPDDLRKDRPGPLAYTKSFVALGGSSREYEVKHVERLQVLKSHSERHLLRSTFEDLKNWAASKTITYRGYFLTTEGQPASYEYLAAQLNLENGDLKKSLPILETIGLIERVSMSMIQGDKLPSGRKRKRPKLKDKSVSANQKIGAPDSVGKKWKLSEKIGKKRWPLRNDNKKSKSKEKAIAPAIANGDGKNKQEMKKRQVTSHTVEVETRTKTEPPKAEPSRPKEADLGGSIGKESFGPPGWDRSSEPQRIGDIAKGIMHRYDPDAKSFGGDVFRALGLSCAPDSPEGRRELGSFTASWMNAKRTIRSPLELAVLRQRAVADAAELYKRRTKYRNLSAVWTDIFNKRVGQ